MNIQQLKEVIWRFYSEGRTKATNQTLQESDIAQMIKLNYGSLMRQKYFESKRLDRFNEPDFSFSQPLLDIQRFNLSEANMAGMRRADMSAVDIMRLPYNTHITNVYPVGINCQGDIGDITQVKAGEENFYLSPDFTFFKFFVIKGKGINTYHLPSCVSAVDIETTYDTNDIEISNDLGFEIAGNILGLSMKVGQKPVKILDNSFDPNINELKRRLTDLENTV